MKNDKVSKESKDLVAGNVDQIKRLFPEVVSEGKIDFERLKAVLGQELDNKEESYSFNWAGRREAFKNIQSTTKGTLVPDEEASISFKDTKNLFIEGDNLEVLKLLQKSYFNQVKMIYIDPPYNTGHDFVYRDDFRNGIKAYLEQTGQLEGGKLLTTNPETSGRFHSDWISMMYPRLFLARNLMRDDGVLFVTADDHEVHNLRRIMDEIFGEDNVEVMVWHKVDDDSGKLKLTYRFRTEHEYVLVGYKEKEKVFFKKYKTARNYKNTYTNPDNDPRGEYKQGILSNTEEKSNPNSETYFTVATPSGKEYTRQWRVTKKEFDDLVADNRIYFGKKGDAVPSIKVFLSEEKDTTPMSILDGFGTAKTAGNELRELFDGKKLFDYPKPVELIKNLIEISTDKDSLIMDFFAGSATTAQAVLQQNLEDEGIRNFILVQLPEKLDEESEAYKEGYRTIADIATERIRRAIKKFRKDYANELKEHEADLGFKVFNLERSNYRIWENYNGQDVKELTKQLDLFKSPLINNYKETNVIYECAIKEGLNLNSNIDPMSDIKGNKIYRVKDNVQSFYICLDNDIKKESLDKLDLKKDDLFICLDSALNDSKKTNISLQCKLKTI